MSVMLLTLSGTTIVSAQKHHIPLVARGHMIFAAS